MKHISTILDAVLAAIKDGSLINPECVCPRCGGPKARRDAALCAACTAGVVK